MLIGPVPPEKAWTAIHLMCRMLRKHLIYQYFNSSAALAHDLNGNSQASRRAGSPRWISAATKLIGSLRKFRLRVGLRVELQGDLTPLSLVVTTPEAWLLELRYGLRKTFRLPR